MAYDTKKDAVSKTAKMTFLRKKGYKSMFLNSLNYEQLCYMYEKHKGK